MGMNTIGTIEQGQAAVQENLDRTMTGLKDGIATATAGVEQAQAQLRDGVSKAVRTAEEMVSFSQGNFEALTKSGQIFATGMQDLSQSFAAAAKASLDDMMGTMRAMASAKSIREAMELQANLLRATMEKAVSQSGQMAEHSMKLGEQAFAPISARLSLASEKFGRAA